MRVCQFCGASIVIWLTFNTRLLTNFHFQDKALSGLSEWLSDTAVSSNPTLLLIAGMIYTHEQNYNDALKYTHVGGTLDL
jgi:hypothetical protein